MELTLDIGWPLAITLMLFWLVVAISATAISGAVAKKAEAKKAAAEALTAASELGKPSSGSSAGRPQ